MKQTNRGSINRRTFLQVSAHGGGGLLIGLSLACKDEKKQAGKNKAEPGTATRPTGPAEPADLNAWIHIEPDDTITLTISESEMGQGILTALAMILAEELDADWSRVRSRHAPADKAAYGRQGTGGSSSVRGGYDSLRTSGAAARQMLIAAAAKRWGVAGSECRTEPSLVIHDASGRKARYGELASAAAAIEPPANPRLKDRKDFRLIGKPIKRLDTPDKVNGSTLYGIDVNRPDMLVATVAHSHTFGGTKKSVDQSASEKVAGVQAIVEIPTGVAVLADHFWAAKKGRDALAIEWDGGENAALSSASITSTMRELAGKRVMVPPDSDGRNGRRGIEPMREKFLGASAREEGDAARALVRAPARQKIKAVYEVPYLAHMPMEPLSCTVQVGDDSCEIWVSTQSPSRVQDTAAEITGLAPDKITVHTMMLGGGFGRRSQADFVAEAVHIAKAAKGRPVKLIWTREDSMSAGYYRPAAYNELHGAIDADGWPVAWLHHIVSPSILSQFGPLGEGIDKTSVEGAANLPYAIANIHVTYVDPKISIPTWFWRSVGSSQNAYVTECFFDELAALGKKDPLEARLHLLADKPRHKRVLELAAEKAGWGKSPGEGHALGLAVHESFGSFVAQVADVSIDNGAVKVHRVICALDCGDIINPDTIAAQMEGGIAYGLSAALHDKIDIKAGGAVQQNFHQHPVLRMTDMPVVETHMAHQGDPLGGIGEPGTPPIAPAVCNAILALTGKPVRKLPIGKLS